MPKRDTLEEKVERAYLRGNEAAWERILLEATIQLGVSSKHRSALVQVAVRRKLRQLCEEFGDNDWPDDLHPEDVIEKHLMSYLREMQEKLERLEGEGAGG